MSDVSPDIKYVHISSVLILVWASYEKKEYAPVEYLSAEDAIKKYAERKCLMVCWVGNAITANSNLRMMMDVHVHHHLNNASISLNGTILCDCMSVCHNRKTA
jgi:hypothetical protein